MNALQSKKNMKIKTKTKIKYGIIEREREREYNKTEIQMRFRCVVCWALALVHSFHCLFHICRFRLFGSFLFVCQLTTICHWMFRNGLNEKRRKKRNCRRIYDRKQFFCLFENTLHSTCVRATLTSVQFKVISKMEQITIHIQQLKWIRTKTQCPHTHTYAQFYQWNLFHLFNF